MLFHNLPELSTPLSYFSRQIFEVFITLLKDNVTSLQSFVKHAVGHNAIILCSPSK